jgi:hypothetical protein
MNARAAGTVASAFLAGVCCGPVLAADLADVTRWTGKEPFTKILGGKSLWDQKGVQEAMRAAMGEPYYSAARKGLLAGPQSPVAADSKGVFVAWSCKAHDCGDNQISVFFDSAAGTAEACVRLADRSGRVRDLWFSGGEARPLPAEACLSSGNDPFALLRKFGSRS